MTTISECINLANNSIKLVGDNFLGAIKCSGILSADFAGIFAVKEDSNTINALSEYRKEKVRIEQQIEAINRSIANAQATIGALNSKIRACDSNDYSGQMRSAGREMDEYRSAANRASSSGAREQAQSQYRAAQRRQEQAAAASRANDRNRSEYMGQRSAAESNLSDCQAQKTNFEKRLAQVEELVSLF